MNQQLKVKRIKAGDYHCELGEQKFTVYRILEHEYRNNALARPNRFGSYTRVERVKVIHWAFNLDDDRGSCAGYGSKKQALAAAVRRLQSPKTLVPLAEENKL